jgi:hypothetical protein
MARIIEKITNPIPQRVNRDMVTPGVKHLNLGLQQKAKVSVLCHLPFENTKYP